MDQPVCISCGETKRRMFLRGDKRRCKNCAARDWQRNSLALFGGSAGESMTTRSDHSTVSDIASISTQTECETTVSISAQTDLHPHYIELQLLIDYHTESLERSKIQRKQEELYNSIIHEALDAHKQLLRRVGSQTTPVRVSSRVPLHPRTYTSQARIEAREPVSADPDREQTCICCVQ